MAVIDFASGFSLARYHEQVQAADFRPADVRLGAQDEGEAEGRVENPLAHDRSVQLAPGPRRLAAVS